MKAPFSIPVLAFYAYVELVWVAMCIHYAYLYVYFCIVFSVCASLSLNLASYLCVLVLCICVTNYLCFKENTLMGLYPHGLGLEKNDNFIYRAY